MMKIIHVIPSLNSGGAEHMLYKLMKFKNNSNYDFEIVSIMSKGFYSEKIEEMGVTIHHLNFEKTKNPIKLIIQLISILRKADIIQSWMYHSDLISFFVGKIIFNKKVIWGIRSNNLNKKLMTPSTYYLAKINRKLSKYIDKVISCSAIGMKNHIKFGYSTDNLIAISNGFNISEYNDQRNDEIRKTLKLGTNTWILLNIARWVPEKDHRTLIKTAGILRDKGIKFKLILVGRGMDEENVELNQQIQSNNLENYITLFGERKDIPYLMKGADLYIASSISEGFPNVIGEAMASSLYCVATNAGDTKYILGETGSIVSPGNSEMLAHEIINAIKLENTEKQRLESLALKRVKNKFSIENIVIEYEQIYENLMRCK